MSAREAGVVIAGGGLAAQRCSETLRRLGYEGRVRIVCAERHRPYDRPPLSKEVLGEEQAADSVSFRSQEWLDERSIEVLEGATARSFDAGEHRLELADGALLDYEHLVIATGSRPRMLEPFARFANVSVLRTIEDSLLLRDLLERGAHLLIIGAGFIGQEVAVAARRRALSVTVVEAAPLPMHGLLGSEIGGWFAALHREEGVELLLGRTAAQIHGSDAVEAVILDDGRRIEADHVLVGVGVAPDVGWTGVAAGGVPVDAGGRSVWPDVYAAGDAAAFYDPFLGRHALSGHWEAAGRQGAAVAHSITAREPPRPALSSFWSDQYGMRIQYLGHAALADAIEIDGDLSARDFVAVYTRAGKAVAALIVGRPRAFGELRERLAYVAEA